MVERGADRSPPTVPLRIEGELRLLLEHVAREPLLGVAARADALGLSRRKMDALKRTLVEEGYLRPVDLPIPQGRTVLLELTDAARFWLAQHRVPGSPVNGSLPHAWWQARVAEMLREKGWSVEVEKRIGGHAFDVWAERDRRTLLLEIETGRSDWLANIAKLEAEHADVRAVLWLDQASLPRARSSLPARIELLTPRTLDAESLGS